MKKELISLVVPCYNEEDAIPLFYEAIKKQIKKMDYVDFELIFINDGSKDKTLEIIRELSRKDKVVRYVSFSRNFGKEAAMYAGFTKWFYKIIGSISKTEMVAGARDYRLMTRQMVNAILDMSGYNRYSKGIFSFVGFDTKWIEYENTKRSAGTTKWNFWKLFAYAIDGIVGFSTEPLIFASLLGVLFCLIAFIMIIFIIVRTIIWSDPVAGWPSMVCIIFFVGGVNLFCTGIIGEYLAKTYLETKKRPIYIVKETESSRKD